MHLKQRQATAVCLGLCVAAATVCGPGWAQDPPPLPPGLEPANNAPALPEGLEPANDAPALPEGLETAGDAPALPEGLDGGTEAPSAEAPEADKKGLPFKLHGFVETRGGVRTQKNAAMPDDATIGELRLQLETRYGWDWGEVDVTGDVFGDGVEEELSGDLRQLRVTMTPLEFLDLRVGRQVLTWGTGDMLFINDLFPKDWQAYFIGRDVEYLKAPSNSAKVGLFSDVVNVEFVYTPQFEPDRYIRGRRVSYYDPLSGGPAGESNQLLTDPPSGWFEEDEFALRIYRSFGAVQAALYGYSGYWKSPAGMRAFPMQATFPKLRVYGASVRGPLLGGIGNLELGYYDSYQDRSGTNIGVNNSEFRLLVGYERELAKEFTAAVQYYLEHMMDYNAYRRTLLPIMPPRDRDRHLLTLRLTKLLLNQNLTLSLFSYFSPTDVDAYLRPKVSYKITDRWLAEIGGNVFIGENDYSFFGQFGDNTNVYAAVRYSF